MLLISFLSQVKTLELVLFFYSHKWAQKKYKKTTNPNIDKRIGIWISKLKSVKVGLGLWPDYTIFMLRTMDTKGSYGRIDNFLHFEFPSKPNARKIRSSLESRFSLRNFWQDALSLLAHLKCILCKNAAFEFTCLMFAKNQTQCYSRDIWQFWHKFVVGLLLKIFWGWLLLICVYSH